MPCRQEAGPASREQLPRVLPEPPSLRLSDVPGWLMAKAAKAATGAAAKVLAEEAPRPVSRRARRRAREASRSPRTVQDNGQSPARTEPIVSEAGSVRSVVLSGSDKKARDLSANRRGREAGRQRSQDEMEPQQRPKKSHRKAPAVEVFPQIGAEVVRIRDGSRGIVRTRSNSWYRVQLENAPEHETVACRRKDLRPANQHADGAPAVPSAVVEPASPKADQSPAPMQSLLRDAPVEDVFGHSLLPPDAGGDLAFEPSPFPAAPHSSPEGDPSPPELADIRELQGGFSSALSSVLLTPQREQLEEPFHAALGRLGEAEKAMTESVAAERSEVEQSITAANSAVTAVERKLNEVLARTRAENTVVEQEWAQQVAAAEKKAADARAAAFKVEEEALSEEQQAASNVSKVTPLPSYETAELDAARQAASELVRTSKAAQQQHMSSCEVRMRLGENLAAKTVQEARAKFQKAENQACLAREKVAEAKDSAHSPDGVAAAKQREAANALEKALAHEGEAKENLVMMEKQVAAIQKSAEARMQQDKLVFQQRVSEAERIASELIANVGMRELSMRIHLDVEHHLSSRKPDIAELPEVERQLRDQKLKSAEMRTRLQAKQEEIRRAAAARVARVERAASTSAAERRLANEQIVQAAEARTRSEESNATKLVEAEDEEARAAEERAEAAQQSALNDIEDAEARADQQGKLLLEQFSDIERAIPNTLDAARSAYLRRAHAAEEQLAKAKQHVADLPAQILPEWTERVKSSQMRLQAVRQAAAAKLAAPAAAEQQAVAAEMTAAEVAREAAMSIEDHIVKCRAEKRRAEHQAQSETQAAQNELTQTQKQSAEVKQMASELQELQKLAHQEELEAVSKKSAALTDAMSRQEQALEDQASTAEAHVRSAELWADQIAEDAKERAEQAVSNARSHLDAVKQQAADAWEHERCETDQQVAAAQETAAAAKSKATAEIAKMEQEIQTILQHHQSKAEQAEQLARDKHDEMGQAQRTSARILQEAIIEQERAHSQTAEALASFKQRLHLVESSAAEAIHKVRRARDEAQQTSDTVRLEHAAERETVRLAQEQLSSELEAKAAKKEEEAVEELAKISANMRTAQEEAKAAKDKIATEIEAAQLSVDEQKHAAVERRKAAERWGRDSIQTARENLQKHSDSIRQLKVKLSAAQQPLEELTRVAKESQQRVADKRTQHNEAQYTKDKVTRQSQQLLADMEKRMAIEVEEGRAEKDERVSQKHKESLAVAESLQAAEAEAQAAEEAAAKAEHSAAEQVEQAQKERDQEIDRLQKTAQQREKKAATLMDCAHHMKDYVGALEDDLVDYFQRSLEARDIPSPPRDVPAPCTPPASQREAEPFTPATSMNDTAGEIIAVRSPRGASSASGHSTPMPTTPIRRAERSKRSSITVRTSKSGVISRVSASVQAPGWGSLKPSVRSALFERSLPYARRHSIGDIAGDASRRSIDGVFARKPT